MPDGKRAVASGAAASSAARGERAEGVLAAEAGRRGGGRGTAETWRAPCWDGTLVESGGRGRRWCACVAYWVRRVAKPAARPEGTGGPVPAGRAAGWTVAVLDCY